jgi:ribosomal protein S18 acetylase RimI-like enzyme
MLMAFVEQQARKEQVKGIRLYTNEVMIENLLFYQKLGFVEEDRRIQDGYRRVFLHKVLA